MKSLYLCRKILLLISFTMWRKGNLVLLRLQKNNDSCFLQLHTFTRSVIADGYFLVVAKPWTVVATVAWWRVCAWSCAEFLAVATRFVAQWPACPVAIATIIWVIEQCKGVSEKVEIHLLNTISVLRLVFTRVLKRTNPPLTSCRIFSSKAHNFRINSLL